MRKFKLSKEDIMDNVRIYKQVIFDIYDKIDEKQKEMFDNTFQEIRQNIKALGDNIELDSTKVLERCREYKYEPGEPGESKSGGVETKD